MECKGSGGGLGCCSPIGVMVRFHFLDIIPLYETPSDER